MSNKPNVHTTPHSNGGWQNITEGKSKPSKIFDTKAEAVPAGKSIAENNNVEHVIHGKNGKIQNPNSYGNDPNPPKDKKH